MRADLAGKRILFMAPRFFGYELVILEALRGRGATVDLLPDRPFDTAVTKAAARFLPGMMRPRAERQFRALLEGFGRPDYDIVFIVNGQTLSRKLLAELRADLPRARFVFHMWDSLGNRGGALEKLDLFDEASSFDPPAAAHGMPLRPLFFSPGFEGAPNPAPDYDISFVGTAHTDRYAVVKSVDRHLPADAQRFWYLYLQAPWVFEAYRLLYPHFRKAKRREFSFEPMTKAAVQDIFRRSHAVLDIEHPGQSGLTMRTLETVGASKKLVTTNTGVRAYDFYDPQNVCVIDRADARVPEDFLRSPYSPVAPDIYRRYSLDGWIDELLGEPSSFARASPRAPLAAAAGR